MTQRVTRREALRMLGAFGATAALGCTARPASRTGSASSGCEVTPEETGGPYVDRLGMLGNPAFLRSDIREGRAGVPLVLALTVRNEKTNCAPVPGARVEVWHCDAEGRYSEYAQPGYDGTGQTFLRGLQVTDAAGLARFTTVYPGWYPGRATHVHLNVFVDGDLMKTTQMAFPEAMTSAVYRTAPYAAHGPNPIATDEDGIFADGVKGELATLTGDTTNGCTGTLNLIVSV